MKVYYIHIADFVSINPLNDTYDMEAFDDKSADAIEGKYKRNWLKIVSKWNDIVIYLL